MRLTRQKQEQVAPQVNMAPMIDVIFLLLIFFVCTSTVTQLEGKLPSQVSQLGPGAGQDTADFPPHIIRLQGDPSGVLVMLDETPFATFKALIEELRNVRTAGDAPVLIKGQGTVPFGYMVAALDACHQAGFQQVAFSSRREEP